MDHRQTQRREQMNVIKARNIANNVGDSGFANSDRQAAFQALDVSADKGNANDRKLAAKIWDYFGNRASKGKTVA